MTNLKWFRLVVPLSTKHRWVVTGTSIQNPLTIYTACYIFSVVCELLLVVVLWYDNVKNGFSWSVNSIRMSIVSVLQRIMGEHVNPKKSWIKWHFRTNWTYAFHWYGRFGTVLSWKRVSTMVIKIGAQQKLAHIRVCWNWYLNHCENYSNHNKCQSPMSCGNLIDKNASKNEIQTKLELRSIVWCLNVISGLHMKWNDSKWKQGRDQIIPQSNGPKITMKRLGNCVWAFNLICNLCSLIDYLNLYVLFVLFFVCFDSVPCYKFMPWWTTNIWIQIESIGNLSNRTNQMRRENRCNTYKLVIERIPIGLKYSERDSDYFEEYLLR